MSRPATNPAVRLQRLEAAREKLTGLKRGETLSAIPMAKLLGVSWPALREWCDTVPGFAASGAFDPGGNGVEYAFRPKKTLDFLIRHFRGVIERQAADSRRISKAVGIELPESETPSYGETKDLVRLTLDVVAAAERQKQYALAEDVANFFEGYNDVVVSGILGVRTKADPNGKLPPEVRKAVDEHLRRLAATVHSRATTFVEAMRAGLQQGGTG